MSRSFGAATREAISSGDKSVEAPVLVVDNHSMLGLRFVRRVDGLTYEFVRNGDAHGFPMFKRADLDLWCRRMPDFGWVVCDESRAVSSRPFADAGIGDLPPEGAWVSYKGDRSYVYDLIYVDAQQF